MSVVSTSFTEHESHRETSVEYTHPGPSPWTYAQNWAQRAVDRPDGAPLPPYEPVYDPEPPEDHLFHGLGVALGRFGPNREGILDPATADLSHALPHGVLLVHGATGEDGLHHPASAPLHAAWASHGAATGAKDLRTWLRLTAFELHRKRYDGKPIHWPLSSDKRTFVVWVTIHRMNVDTLRVVRADHLVPLARALDGQRDDVEQRRDNDGALPPADEKRLVKLEAWRAELAAFMAAIEQCAERGAPSPKAGVPAREVDARYAPDLDDGVMINSAGLWPLLAPQWSAPKGWWAELATASGRKDYDWSHLAARYWPSRVDGKCQSDPSLAVAHGCFWRYHPERAYKWELRLQDEIGPEFVIEEAGSDAARAAWLADHPEQARELRAAEQVRRERKARKDGAPAPDDEDGPQLGLMDGADDDDD
jgi:hypothetical protein